MPLQAGLLHTGLSAAEENADHGLNFCLPRGGGGSCLDECWGRSKRGHWKRRNSSQKATQ